MKAPAMPNAPATNLSTRSSALIKLAPPEAGALDDAKNWLTQKEAAHLLHLSRRTILRMCETIDRDTGRPFLRAWRPSPRTLMICRRSLQQFCQITQNDPEFWERRGKEIAPLSAAAVMKPLRRSGRASSVKRS